MKLPSLSGKDGMGWKKVSIYLLPSTSPVILIFVHSNSNCSINWNCTRKIRLGKAVEEKGNVSAFSFLSLHFLYWKLFKNALKIYKNIPLFLMLWLDSFLSFPFRYILLSCYRFVIKTFFLLNRILMGISW